MSEKGLAAPRGVTSVFYAIKGVMRMNVSEGRIFSDMLRLHFLKLHQTISGVGLGKGQPTVLKYLTEHDGCVQSQIARGEKKTAATTTVMLQTMEKNGLIERRSDPEDMRRVKVYITEKGREADRCAKEALEKMEEDIFSALTDRERREFFRLAEKLNGRMRELLNMEEEK